MFPNKRAKIANQKQSDCQLRTPAEVLMQNQCGFEFDANALLPVVDHGSVYMGTLLYFAAVHCKTEQEFVVYVLHATNGIRLKSPIDEPSGPRMEFAFNVALARGWSGAVEMM